MNRQHRPDGEARRPGRPAAATPADRLADGFATHVAAWARRAGASDAAEAAVRAAAAALSRATSEGHVCLPLASIGADRATLLASNVVGTAEMPRAMPLVLDRDGRLYLHRYFDYERRLARRLADAARAEPFAIDAATAGQLNHLFRGNERLLAGAADWQKIATALALRSRLTVVSGGPGTGKTTTVVNLLACLLAQNPACRVALAAPTGKAAARMTEAIRERAAHLPEALRERLPAGASTVHRLLGVTPTGFVHHAGRPLAIDVLVVDEASMLDLALATRLLEAVPATARVVLLGDKDQLAAVEAGAVFSELSACRTLSPACRRALAAATGVAPEALGSAETLGSADAIGPEEPLRLENDLGSDEAIRVDEAGRLDEVIRATGALVPAEKAVRPDGARGPGAVDTPLRDSVVWFTRNFRFAADSAIGRLAGHVNADRPAAALALLREGAADASVHWLDEPGAATLQCLFDGYAAYLDAVRQAPTDPHRASAAFAAFRALCAVREGPRGLLALNDRMTRHAREALGLPGGGGASAWFVGRPVLVLRNDPVLGLFNGDVGLTLADATGAPLVFFADDAGGFRRVAPLRLPVHQTAFAMTVHKAQGSEFDAVLVVLPERAGPVVSRELLYTAVTRARQRVVLSASEDVLVAAIASPTRRDAGLRARLADALAAPTAIPP